MLAFIDESGSIHPKDSNPISILFAVCMPERVHRGVSRQLYSIEKLILGNEMMRELKAADLLNRRTFARIEQKRELVERVFSVLASLEITTFAIIVPRPTRPLKLPKDYLPKPHAFLLQRINALAEKTNQEAVLVYDGNGMNVQGMNMASSISNYIFRVAEFNNVLRRVVDTPLFVDSKVTPGIQLADLAASVVRQYEQNRLINGVPKGDVYLSAIERYYQIVHGKTMDDLLNDKGNPLYGFYKMQEAQLYLDEDPDN
ncbi:MAG: DUF3800 domain-containing protein [Chloroflexi bacterium]|nr:DUF3800 domain-containing protein [Chloroflexota bacterium]MBI5053690.1 DUF3800 domain-containing protein [Chloroflexota bacterium]MBI5081200.1 DUF3800 domain-containing protein [Chloroflexota bacterium]MBI5714532.1 DUF3800 domain-containing protein [Chloroflexota bacterium]